MYLMKSVEHLKEHKFRDTKKYILKKIFLIFFLFYINYLFRYVPKEISAETNYIFLKLQFLLSMHKKATGYIFGDVII